MVTLMKSHPDSSFATRRKRSAGMTFLEIVVAFGIFSGIMLTYMQSQLSVLLLNQTTKFEASGTNVIRRQLEEAVSMAYDNKDKAGGVAKGYVYYLRRMRDRLETAGNPSDHPITVTLNGSILTYTFAVPEPGWSPMQGDELAASPSATGTIRVFLNEAAVPAEFDGWGDLAPDGTITLNTNGGFDMNDNGKLNDDFTDLLGVGALFGQSDLMVVPGEARIVYYANPGDKQNGVRPVYETVRYFLINDEEPGSPKNYGTSSGSVPVRPPA